MLEALQLYSRSFQAKLIIESDSANVALTNCLKALKVLVSFQ